MTRSRRFGATLTALLVPVMILCGCDAADRFASPIDRINAAMPPAPQVIAARQSLLAEIAANKSLARDEA